MGYHLAFTGDWHGRRIEWYDGSWRGLWAYSLNTWYKVKLALDLDAKTFDIYVNGVLEHSGAAPAGACLLGGVRRLGLANDTGYSGSAFFDDICISRPNRTPGADAGDDVTAECTSSAGASVTLDGSGSSDQDGDTLSYEWSAAGIAFDDETSATPTGTFPLGTTTVTLTVSDGDGETNMDTVLVEVVDTMPPSVSCSIDTDVLWPPNHKMTKVTVDTNAADASGSITIAASVRSNEAEDGLGDGDTSPDWANISVSASGQVTLDLRAERSGRGGGRTYTIAITATDSSGNATTETCEVVVHKSKGKQE